MKTEPGDRWISMERLLRFTYLGAVVTGWFLIVYAGADWVTRQHSFRVPIAMRWERSIPFVPASVVLYMSVYGLFFAAPFVFRKTSQLDQFARELLLLITFSGIGFLLIPAESAFEPQPLNSWSGWIRIAEKANLSYNFVPSLHVGFAVACAAAYEPYLRRWMAMLAWTWAVGVAASTLLLHQHHIMDVLSGWILAWACVRYSFRDELCE